MICRGFETLDGCGICVVGMSDETMIGMLCVSDVVDILDVLFEFCMTTEDREVSINNSTITCTGSIDISYTDNPLRSRIPNNRSQCRYFINLWCQQHQEKVWDSVLIIYLLNMCRVLRSYGSTNELLHEFSGFNNSINELYTVVKP